MTLSGPYVGIPNRRASTPQTFDTGLRDALDKPQGYLPAADLVTAVNAAMLLGQPLLLNGEPGTGKSGLAGAVAYELGLGAVLRVNCKANMRSEDLFYRYDHMRRLHDANAQTPQPPESYLGLQGLGAAIVYAAGAEATATPIQRGSDPRPLAAMFPALDLGAPRQSVVLIDEIDKAPRDVPNDILVEIDAMRFDIPELGVTIAADTNRKPLVVITSNSEKALPAPFLRRCVFYTIPFPPLPEEVDRNPALGAPDAEGRPAYTLENIVASRIARLSGTPLLADALKVFSDLRQSGRLEHRPSLAEFMNWLLYLSRNGPGGDWRLRSNPTLVTRSLRLLLKSSRDQENGGRMIAEWLKAEGQ